MRAARPVVGPLVLFGLKLGSCSIFLLRYTSGYTTSFVSMLVSAERFMAVW